MSPNEIILLRAISLLDADGYSRKHTLSYKYTLLVYTCIFIMHNNMWKHFVTKIFKEDLKPNSY